MTETKQMPIKDENARRKYNREYARLRRAGLNKKSQTVKPVPLIEDDILRLETARGYLDVLNRVILDVRSDEMSSTVQKARVIGYLVNVALKALEMGVIEERLEQLEAAINTAEAWR